VRAVHAEYSRRRAPHRERSEVTTNRDTPDAQREHWQATFEANPDMYGIDPSQPGAYAAEVFKREHVREVLELGAGQGRDTLAFLRAGLQVTALDYAPKALARIHQAAAAAGRAERLVTLVHDVRQPVPLPDASVDAVYSHMLFNMALSTAQLLTLADEVRRVLRPGGLHIYTVRHTGDAHYGAGSDHGDGMFENGGFIVHFFDRALVDRLAVGYTMLDLTGFEEGDLPRRLWRIILRRDQPTGGM
jgi:SAM-dependent methyltransferase